MGVIESRMFPGEAYTPICSNCGVALCWDIALHEYEQRKQFWDDWKCESCDPKYKKRGTKRIGNL
jgi:hypothetical protein